MKQLLILLIFVTATIGSYAQFGMGRPAAGSLDISTISGTDTTIFIPFKKVDGRVITFDFTEIFGSTETLDFGYSSNDSTFTSANSFPLTLDSVTYVRVRNTAQGTTTRERLAVKTLNYQAKYVAFSITTGTGILRWEYE